MPDLAVDRIGVDRIACDSRLELGANDGSTDTPAAPLPVAVCLVGAALPVPPIGAGQFGEPGQEPL
jgi:hypothetical protein